MFEGQPKGLFALALANTGERFGYYTMLAVFVLFLQSNFGMDENQAGKVYSDFLMFVYFLPVLGGALADKFGFGRCVTLGIFVMFLGYLLLSLPVGDTVGMTLMYVSLLFIAVGTSLFKGNLQVMVGNLYDAPELQHKRDSAFSLFYMAINIGALFAPTAAVKITDYAKHHWVDLSSLTPAQVANPNYIPGEAYHYAFAVACVSLIVSILIYYVFRSTFRHADYNSKTAPVAADGQPVELSKKETKDRLVALFLVFAVVIFFWMSFHQNGLTLTYFAESYTAQKSYGAEAMMFDVTNLVGVIFIVYALFQLFQTRTNTGRLVSLGVIAVSVAFLGYKYTTTESCNVIAPIFQQFNPFFVVVLTPVSMAFFAYLAKIGKEPSAPRKIGIGMFIAAAGFGVMMLGSHGLPVGQATHSASPNLLVSTYLVLTFAELFLSPMGISFVSKVAPPKLKGLMMGGWFAATAIGNKLTWVPAYLWGKVSFDILWGVLAGLCLLSCIFIFSVMKRLEKVC
ncbi:MAG: peptide MFS transporter [Prevotellaceae bacterium]|nr:peptide MFS transporter [Prevotellaceae bacterium]